MKMHRVLVIAIASTVVGFSAGAVVGNMALAPIRLDVEAVSAFGTVVAALSTLFIAVLGLFGYRRVFVEHEIKDDLTLARRLLEDLTKLRYDGEMLAVSMMCDVLSGDYRFDEVSSIGQVPDAHKTSYREVMELLKSAEAKCRVLETHLQAFGTLMFPLTNAKLRIHSINEAICDVVKGVELEHIEEAFERNESIIGPFVKAVLECEETVRSLTKSMKRGSKPRI